MTLQNTIHHYLETISSDSPGITCPACGSIMGIRRQGSTEMILTENARLELDGYLASYRRFLEKLELLLEQQNIYHKPYPGSYPYKREVAHYKGDNEVIEFNRGGIYKGIVAEPVIDKLVQELDFFQWIESFYSFPRRLERQEISAQDIEAMSQKATSILLGGLEPRSIAGSLMDLIFDQAHVSAWREKIIKSISPETWNNFLNTICPAIQGYLSLIYNNPKGETARMPFSAKSQSDPDLKEGVFRVQFILVALLGHCSKESNAVHLNEIGVTPGVPLTLPRKTIVSPKHLQELLQSEPVLGNPRIGLSQDLLRQLKQDMGANRDSNGGQASVEEILMTLRHEIHQFVHFTCSGPVGKQPITHSDDKSSTSKETSDDKSSTSKETCGWYPKPEPTHSVILLGSPGTGKSSVMLTGFTTFYDNIFALGATISFDSPEDEVQMRRLNEDYWAGKMPQPTEKGARTTIKLSVEFPEEHFRRANYVFTDIAGEVMARSLTDEGSDPAVLRILKNAETIIFFFDISIEPSIRKKLTEGDDGTWKSVEDNFARVCKHRMEEDKDNSSRPQKAESRASVSQLQLLKRLIRDLQVQRGTDDLESADLNFICVVPKLDLYVNEANKERYFFSELVEELKRTNILVHSNRGRGDESFTGLRSLGGTLAKFQELGPTENGSSGNSGSVSIQKHIGQWLSERTLNHLSKIGNALDPGTAAPIKASLSKTLEVGLIATLHHVFGKEKVYFLPVSAQGKDSDDLELGDPPNQKLSEYVFILPVVLSVKEIQARSVPNDMLQEYGVNFAMPQSSHLA